MGIVHKGFCNSQNVVEELNKVIANLRWNKVKMVCAQESGDMNNKTTDFFNFEQKLTFGKFHTIQIHQRKLQIKLISFRTETNIARRYKKVNKHTNLCHKSDQTVQPQDQ